MLKLQTRPASTSTFSGILSRRYANRMGPENVLVVYRSGDAAGQAIAEYYQQQRSIPTTNFIAVTTTWTTAATATTTVQADAILAQIVAGIDAVEASGHTILSILTCGHWPTTSAGSAQNAWTWSELLMLPHWFADNGAEWNTTTADGLLDFNVTAPNGPDCHGRLGAYFGECNYRKMSRWPSAANGDISQVRNNGYYFARMPLDRLTQDFGTLDEFPHTLNEYNRRICVHFRLEAPNGEDEVTFCSRLINDALAAEAMQMADWGTVLLNGGYTGAETAYLQVSNYVLAEMSENSYPTTNVYWYDLDSTGEVNSYDPRCPSRVDSMTSGNTTFLAGEATYPNPMSDVFLRSTGFHSYYGIGRRVENETDFIYRQGAIVGFSMSYSYSPAAFAGHAWDIAASILEEGEKDALAANAPLRVTNSLSYTTVFVNLQRSAGPTTATAQVLSGTVSLREDSVVIASASIAGQTLAQAWDTLKTLCDANTGWSIASQSGQAPNRCITALKNGACIAIGSCVEPFTVGAFKATMIFNELWWGDCIGELAFKLHMPNNTYYDIEWDYYGAPTNDYRMVSKGMIIVGDPLYRPFGHREIAELQARNLL